MLNDAYQVVPFTEDNLVYFFSQKSAFSDLNEIRRRPQIRSITNYCERIGVKTIVFEKFYTDRHFLEDYSGHYSRCFEDYGRICGRLHFFGKKFTKRRFLSLLRDFTPNKASDVLPYFGFAVIKPLPWTIVGRTCLQPAELDGIGVEFPTLFGQSANLFGIDLSVQSIPFQEQDQEVAACATSALWSVLNGTARLYRHQVLSPFEVTKAATLSMLSEHRAIPNDGLDFEQTASAIRFVGLEPVTVTGPSINLLNLFAYAYLRAKIPLLLGFDFNIEAEGRRRGHAVALCGYELGENESEETGFRYASKRILRFFAHDDGAGPFSSIYVDSTKDILSTEWTGADGENLPARFIGLQIPVYHKIRIPLDAVYTGIAEFYYLTEGVLKSIGYDFDVEWEVFLSHADEFRKYVLHSHLIPPRQKEKIVTQNTPRFLWRAIATGKDGPVLEFVLDATDIAQGTLVVCILLYDENLGELMLFLADEKIDDGERLSRIAQGLFKGLRSPKWRNAP